MKIAYGKAWKKCPIFTRWRRTIKMTKDRVTKIIISGTHWWKVGILSIRSGERSLRRIHEKINTQIISVRSGLMQLNIIEENERTILNCVNYKH